VSEASTSMSHKLYQFLTSTLLVRS